MNWLDILILLWLGLSAFSGLKTGFIYKAGSLVGLIVGIWISSKYTSGIAQWFGGGLLSHLTVFLFLLGLVSKLFGILVWSVDKVFSLLKVIPFLGMINRLLGAALSVLISLVMCTVGFVVADFLSQDGDVSQLIHQSWFGALLVKFSVILIPLLSNLMDTVL